MYIGIDLGTTNSVITSFDGKETRVWKSPQQNDVTPSVIYISKRAKYYGQDAYKNGARDPDNTAKLFKRYMGTSTKMQFKQSGIEMTPEECSAEILKTLFGYLPEEIRNDNKTGTVVTVPAAFNQMQKDATKQAAFMAGIKKIALIQEPVAAIMSIAKSQNVNGMFIVYDFGGGTFDVSVAERNGSKINLLTNDGIQHCGGRDFDKQIFENIVVPWLYDNFNLPEDFRVNKKYALLLRLADWATEQAKIELSSKDSSAVRLDEVEARCCDEDGTEIYLDVPISREQYNNLIMDRVDETIAKTREVLANIGLKPEDISNIVFIGGPTQYKPLRDRVSQELGIAPNFDINPMTAVSEGAAIYAESVNFETASGGQKADKGIIKSSSLGLEFRYNARTSADKAKIAVVFKNAQKLDFVFKSVDTGWSSGKMSLASGSIITVDINNLGENTFTVQCFDENGNPVKLENSTIIITKTLINIGKIPCAHSIGVEYEDTVTHTPKLAYLIRKDDLLPKSGVMTFKTTKRIAAGSPDSISFKLWEGEIDDPVEYNRFIGDIKIDGTSFDYGMIPQGSPLECSYTFDDSGNIDIKINVPAVGITLSGENFYNRLSGQIDYNSDIDKIIQEAQNTLDKIDEMNENLYNEDLSDEAEKLRSLLENENLDAEELQALFELTQESKGVVAKYMRENKAVIWQKELDDNMKRYNDFAENATPAQEKQVESLSESIQKAIDTHNPKAEKLLSELGKVIAQIMLNNDEIYLVIFYQMTQSPQDFSNPVLYNQLIAQGQRCVASKDINGLKNVIARLYQIMIPREGSDLENMIKGSGITI